MNADELSAEYDRLRAELKRLLEAPVRDMAAVQKVVDRLDDVHMRFKAAQGLHGNNRTSDVRAVLRVEGSGR